MAMNRTQIIKRFNEILEDGLKENKTVGAMSKRMRGPVAAYLKELTYFMDRLYPDSKANARLDCYLKDMRSEDDLPKCVICGAPAKISEYFFTETCKNKKCINEVAAIKNKDPELVKRAKEKRKITMNERYGVDSMSQMESVKKKKKETAIKNYGSLKAAYHDTAKKTIQKKYNVDNVSQLDSIKQKKIETSRKNYGTDYPWQSEKGREEQLKGVQDKYGVDNVSQVQEIHMKKFDKSSKKYITPLKKEILYEGREWLYLDYIFSQIDENLVETQPKINIKYKDENLKERVWYPDIKLNINNEIHIIELKDITMLSFKDCRLLYRINEAIGQGYVSYSVLYYGNKLYKLMLNSFENKHWTVENITGDDPERIKEMLLEIKDFDIIDIN